MGGVYRIMSNDYAGQPTYSKHITELMRRINALAICPSNNINIAELKVYNNKIVISSEYGGLGNFNKDVMIYGLDGSFINGFGLTYSVAGIDVAGDEIFVSIGRNRTYNKEIINVHEYDGTIKRTYTNTNTASYYYNGSTGIAVSNGLCYVIYTIHNYGSLIYTRGVRVYNTNGSMVSESSFNEYVISSPYKPIISNSYIYAFGGYIRVYNLSGYVANHITISGRNFIGGAFLNNYLYVISNSSTANHLCKFSVNGSSLVLNNEYELQIAPAAIAVYNDEIYLATQISGIYIYSSSGSQLRHVNTYGYKWLAPKTTFYGYKESEKESLGNPYTTPNIPTNNALCEAFSGAGADLVSKHIIDMRTAIQSLVATNKFLAANGKTYNFTANSANNLYYVAMGNRTKYGATGGAKYTWTRTASQMTGTSLYDIDIGEIAECVSTLESATRA